MATGKFHITDSKDVRPCNATKRVCRYGELDHYDDKKEALVEAEKLASEEFYSEQTISKNSNLKNIVKSPVHLSSSIEGLKQAIKKYDEILKESRLTSYSDKDSMLIYDKLSEAQVEIGKQIDEELKSRLDFDPFTEELNTAQWMQIGRANQAILKELDNNRIHAIEKIDIRGIGQRAKNLKEVISLLPSQTTEEMAGKFVAISGGADARTPGTHAYGWVPVYGELTEKMNNQPDNLPNGSLILKNFYLPDEVSAPGAGVRVYMKDSESEKQKQFWIGAKPSSSSDFKLKKISDTADVYVNGQLLKLDKPTYEIQSKSSELGSQIKTFGASSTDGAKSVILHEYCHALQARNIGQVNVSEESMFNKLSEGKKDFYSIEFGGKVVEGFPDNYMGLANGRELLTVSTEAIMYPHLYDRQLLYGKDRGPMADKVRQWATGLWAQIAVQ